MTKSDQKGEPKLDDIDQRIVECVMQNPRISVEAIARQLDEDHSITLSESTIQKRLAELLTKRVVERCIVVQNWNAAGFPLRYRIDAAADMRQLRIGRGGPLDDKAPISTQKELAVYIKDVLGRRYQNRLIILDVVIVFGRANSDISIIVRAKDPQDVFDFVTGGLRVLGGIVSTMTCQEAWIHGEEKL
jgi:DNA-binding Lrp family transcriptional regulator